LIDFPLEIPFEIVDFPIRHGDFPIKNRDFPIKNDDFGDFPIKNKMQPTNPNAHTYVNGADVKTHGYAIEHFSAIVY